MATLKSTNSRRRHNIALAERTGEGWRLPLEQQWRVGPPDVLAWMQERWTDHPLACFDQPIRLRHPAGAGLPRRYIRCMANVSTGELFKRFPGEPGWQIHQIPADHMAMVTAPRVLADLLLSIA